MGIQDSETINSTEYWDQRFVADWKENNGVEQSQFFSRIAVDHLPTWFIRYVKQHQPSVCDWGCAMGDGTRMLHELLALKNITGIDFSRVAIEQARSCYPTIPFIAIDIRKDEHFPPFDIIFTSNTLEHFENPWEILDRLSRFAAKFIVILIPYQEYDRHFEHFYTFETTNVPATVQATHFLTYVSVFNAAEYPFTHWNGQQILLIYSSISELSQLGLTLADLGKMINTPPPAPDTHIADAMDALSEVLLTRTSGIQDEQKELQQNLFQLKEQLDLGSGLLHERLDRAESLQKELLAEKRETAARLQVLNAGITTAIQSLQTEMLEENKKTAKKLLLLNDSLDTIKESLSRDLITRMRDLFSKRTR